MGDGTKEKPLTREDVLRLIKENGNTAEGLDLSGKTFVVDIDLRNLDLSRIALNEADLSEGHLEGANLEGSYLKGTNLERTHLERGNLLSAHLEGADLVGTHLEGADLTGANLKETALMDTHLEGTNLMYAHLEGADLTDAHLEGANLLWAEYSHTTELGSVDWGNYILGEERKGLFNLAVDSYRKLKQWYTTAGIYDEAGRFFFREMTAKRKMLKWWPKPWNTAFSKLLSILCGYGERPFRVVASATVVVLGLALIYFIIGSVWEWWAFWKSLYFSAVSFTALGYGSWLQMTNDWIRAIGAFESFVGVFMMALFLITFIRKMTR